MSEMQWGVLLGGIIGIIGSLLTQIFGILFQGKRWAREQKLTHLKEKKAQFEVVFEEIGNMINEITDANINTPPANIVFMVSRHCPIDVQVAFKNLHIMSSDRTPSERSKFVESGTLLAESMRDAIFKLDKEIESLF